MRPVASAPCSSAENETAEEEDKEHFSEEEVEDEKEARVPQKPSELHETLRIVGSYSDIRDGDRVFDHDLYGLHIASTLCESVL